MSLGLVGRKVGMTRIFTDDGDSQPVTVLDVSNNRVTQIKTPGKDGYSAVQVTLESVAPFASTSLQQGISPRRPSKPVTYSRSFA